MITLGSNFSSVVSLDVDSNRIKHLNLIIEIFSIWKFSFSISTRNMFVSVEKYELFNSHFKIRLPFSETTILKTLLKRYRQPKQLKQNEKFRINIKYRMTSDKRHKVVPSPI